MPNPLPPTPDLPVPSDKRRRTDGGTELLKWVTGLSLIGSLIFALSFVICFRYDQRAVTQPNGTVIWHEEGLHAGGWFVLDATLNLPQPPAAKPIIEWLGFHERAGLRRGIFGGATETTSGAPLATLPIFLLLVTAAIWIRRFFIHRRNRKRADRCRECGYEKAGLDLPTCPECGASWAAITSSPNSSPMSSTTRRPGSNAALTLACALLALWFFCLACELSPHLWIDWLILWPLLIVACVPVFVCVAIGRPRTTALMGLLFAAIWLTAPHTTAYAYVLVHWTPSPGVGGSKGLDPETIKAIFCYGGGVLLVLVAALTAYGAPRRRQPDQSYEVSTNA